MRSRHNPEAILRRLEWTVLRRLDGLLQGDHRTLFRGFGLDLADLREYQFHDDVRLIDWNVTARLQEPYVREYHEDRDITAWFLVDTSASIEFGSQEVDKRTVALDFVGVLARLLTRRGNRVGCITYNVGLDRTIPPRSGRAHVLQILDVLGQPPTQREGRPTDLGEFLRSAHQIMRRRSLVFVISDFISTPGWDGPLSLLARRHELLAVRLFDPLEMALPDLGLVAVQDAETGEQLIIDTHDRAFRERFAAAAQRRESELRGAFERAGVDVLELSTDDDLLDVLLRFADLRKNRSQLAANGRLPTHLTGNR